MRGNPPPVPQHIIDAIRTVLGVKAQASAERRDARREARTALRVWLSEIGTAAPTAQKPLLSFQERVRNWMLWCFGAEIAADRIERNHRFFEESTELVQACGMSREDAHKLVDYTYDRPIGEKHQEVGGVMVTLAALCLANDINVTDAAETEYKRISDFVTMHKIRAKQASKPKFSPLPE